MTDTLPADNPQDIAQEWSQKAEAILQRSPFQIADGEAWQREAAKAGAPLSKEPLASLRAQIADTIKSIQELQHRSMVQKEAALLLAQRIDVLSTKSWQHAAEALEPLQADIQKWQGIAQQLQENPNWGSIEPRYHSALDNSGTQLSLVFTAFSEALALAKAAAENPQAELPQVQVWADELRALHGLSLPADTPAVALTPEQTSRIEQAIAKTERIARGGQAKDSAQAAAALRDTLKATGATLDQALEERVNRALIDAGDLQGWQRWGANQVREELIRRADGLLSPAEGQPAASGSRKLQQQLRELREHWRQVDRANAPNAHLWKRFDEAASKAHAIVEEWLVKVKAEAAEHKAERNRLLDEFIAWGKAHAEEASQDLKGLQRQLQQWNNRWRNAGHVSDKLYTGLQERWKAAHDAIAAPVEQAQKESIAIRRSLIEEAQQLASAAELNINAVKNLQQRWQAQAHTVSIDRKQEQKLWEAFRKPLDDAFNRKSSQREQQASAPLSAHDQSVLQASAAVEEAIRNGDVAAIREAVQALEQASRQGAAAEAPAASSTPAATATAADATSETAATGTAEADTAAVAAATDETTATTTEAAPAPVAAPAPAKPLIARRGDDRPGQPRTSIGAAVPARERDGQKGKGREGRDGRDSRDGRERRSPVGGERAPRAATPRLGDKAFRAQRNALENAQLALRKLASQAHGESLVQLLDAWQKRDVATVPPAAQLGKKVSNAQWTQWQQAIGGSAADASAAQQALLRLEIAAEVPTPAEALPQRRALQLQLLTQKHAASPAETWQADVGKVLAAPADDDSSKRLQNALKALLRK